MRTGVVTGIPGKSRKIAVESQTSIPGVDECPILHRFELIIAVLVEHNDPWHSCYNIFSYSVAYGALCTIERCVAIAALLSRYG